MTRTVEELAMILIENRFISASNPLELKPENSKLFDCEFIWYDDINDTVKSVNWNYDRQGNPDLNILESICVGVSPIRYIQLLKTIKNSL